MFIIDKIFNLKIDTKNKNITNITGFKQFDNNSVLNITLLQNNLALDLSNCTVRLNFLREDERILLYMADIVSAKEGKVSIKLSPEVLEKYGLVKADISVFDSNLLKITSATFNLRVEKSIYNDTYFTDKDLDLMQQEYAREKERQKAESARSENELERITKEGQRNSNENTRNSNEEARKKAESTRVSEWNNVKKDANNIKNTLETTIDTANKSNSNLQSTINAGDKLKQELTPQNYVTNEKYNVFEKKTNSQYEDLVNYNKSYYENFGVNLLRNSGYIKDLNYWKQSNGGDALSENFAIKTGHNGVLSGASLTCIKKPDGGWSTLINTSLKNNYKFTVGTAYTISGCIWCDKNSVVSLQISNNNATDYVFGKTIKCNCGYNYFCYTFEPKITGNENMVIFGLMEGITIYIPFIKLEIGDIATPWTINPNEILVNSQRLDAIEKILINKGFMTATQNL